MPSLSRRGFLQFAGAASVTPLLPAIPSNAVAAPAGASVSQALWKGIYAKAGSAPKFVGVAQGMGLSGRAIQGVSARSIGVKLVVPTAAKTAAKAAKPASAALGSVRPLMKSPISASGKAATKLNALAKAVLQDAEDREQSDQTVPDAEAVGTDTPDSSN